MPRYLSLLETLILLNNFAPLTITNAAIAIPKITNNNSLFKTRSNSNV